MPRFTRQELLARFRAMVERRQPIIGGGAHVSPVARHALHRRGGGIGPRWRGLEEPGLTAGAGKLADPRGFEPLTPRSVV